MIGDLAFLILSGLVCTAIGSMAWRIAIGRWPRNDEWLGIGLPLGLGLTGTLAGIAACTLSFEAGLVSIAILATFSLVAVLAAFGKVSKSAGDFPGSISTAAIAIMALVLFVCVPGLFAPVIDGDALCYHLEVAKRMVQDDHVRFDPDLHETAYPLVVESLQAIALRCRGPVAVRAISFWFGIALAFGSTCLAGSIVKGRARYWAAALVLITPVVHCGMISPLNDIALAALCIGALTAWNATEADSVPAWRRFAVAGTFCGLACGVKFPGIVWLAVFAMFLLTDLSKQAMRANFVSYRAAIARIAVFASFVVLVGGFWYARAAVLTGNPVHPYFRDTFGGHGLDEVLEDARKPLWAHVSNIMTAPIGMALEPGRFDSFSHQSGPLFLALIPLGFLSHRGRLWHSYVFLGWLLMALCLTQRQSPRFFVATFALWAAAATAVIEDLLRIASAIRPENRKLARIPIAGLCLLGLFAVTFDLARVRVGALVLVGQVSPHEWLNSNEPTAQLREWVETNLPPGATLIGQDHRAFYWPRRFTMEKAHRRRTGLLETTKTPEESIAGLRAAGFTHLVMAEPDPVDAVEFDTHLSDRLSRWLAANSPLLDVTLPEIDGYVRRYRIFEIDDVDVNSNASNFESGGEAPAITDHDRSRSLSANEKTASETIVR